jgi:hypothetical protein
VLAGRHRPAGRLTTRSGGPLARRKAAAAPDPSEGPLILPRHLADNHECTTVEELREFHRERREWLTAHGINPRSWGEVYPILRALLSSPALCAPVGLLWSGTA